MDTKKLLENSYTRVWIEKIAGKDVFRLYGARTEVETVIIKPHSAIIVLREFLTAFPGSESLVFDFEKEHNIYVTHCEVGRPDNFQNNEPILTMRNCEIRATFVEHPVILEPSDQHPVQAILIAESWDYTWRKK